MVNVIEHGSEDDDVKMVVVVVDVHDLTKIMLRDSKDDKEPKEIMLVTVLAQMVVLEQLNSNRGLLVPKVEQIKMEQRVEPVERKEVIYHLLVKLLFCVWEDLNEALAIRILMQQGTLLVGIMGS